MEEQRHNKCKHELKKNCSKLDLKENLADFWYTAGPGFEYTGCIFYRQQTGSRHTNLLDFVW